MRGGGFDFDIRGASAFEFNTVPAKLKIPGLTRAKLLELAQAARVDILDKHGSRGCAVALPEIEIRPRSTPMSTKEKRSVHARQRPGLLRKYRAACRGYILYQNSARARTVALP